MPYPWTGPTRARARIALAALLALLLLACAAPARAAELGTVPDITWGISRAEVDRTVALMDEAGIRWARTNINWVDAEPERKGEYDERALEDFDYAIRRVREAGIRVLMPIADGVPHWASADPARREDADGHHWNHLHRPREWSDYADFARFVAARYRPMGVHHYEVWNEPNHPRFWPSGPDARAYAEMLRAAYPAIRQGDPEATVLLGGLAANDYYFLQNLYDAGAGAYFDAASVHPYVWPYSGLGSLDPDDCFNELGTTRPSSSAFCGIEMVHRVMSANGDGDKPVWVTEFGWATYDGAYGVSEEQQADYLIRALRRLERHPYVPVAMVYHLRNLYWEEDANSWGGQLGLLRTDFSPKPAWQAIKAYGLATRATPAPPGGTGPGPAPPTGTTPAPSPPAAGPPAPSPALEAAPAAPGPSPPAPAPAVRPPASGPAPGVRAARRFPTVTARLQRGGRVLRWSTAPALGGHRITFVERDARGRSRVLGRTTRARGRLVFRSRRGAGGWRVLAIVRHPTRPGRRVSAARRG